MGFAAAVAVAACLYTPFDMDSYLFSLYERAPKFDDSGPFGWKDGVSATRAGMSLKQYVIGGIDSEFRRKFAHAAHLMELWGLDPTINSAYRDDYRQGMIRGGGANAPGHSFHGGSRVGGWGNGLAIDTVSAKATGTTQKERLAASRPVWDWIDKFGPSLGIGRAYGDGDPPHVTPTSSREYAARHGTMHTHSARHHHRRHAHKHARVAHR